MVRSTTLFFFIFLIGFSFSQKSKDIIICGAEKTESVNGKMFFVSDSQYFNQGEQQNSQYFFTGSHSVAVSKKSPYGFTYEIKNTVADDAYRVSVWRKGKGGLVVSANLSNLFYKCIFVTKEEKNGWEKIEYQFNIPPNIGGETIRVYVFNEQNDVCYFDDLKIEKLKSKIEYPEYESEESINLIIDSVSFAQLNKKRTKAFEKGVLTTEKDSWIKGKLVYKGDTNKIKLRLKGDWLDHLQNDKWSFRVKMKKGHVQNIREFSLHNPSSRGYLSEWRFHQIFHQEDILTTTYEFIPLKLNGRSLGIYAFEEHFEKELLENKNRREGPLLKFDETGFWEVLHYEVKVKKGVSYLYPFFNSTTITPFSKKRTMRDPQLKELFLRAQNKLNSYKTGKCKVSDVFDIEKLAKSYVLRDIFGGYHGLVWHNQRFYFNPLSDLIEPISYDAFPNNKQFKFSGKEFLGYNLGRRKTNYRHEKNFVYNAFNDSSFRRVYFEQLNYYLKEYDWSLFNESIKKEEDLNIALLRKEFPKEELYIDFMKKIKSIKDTLESIDLNLEEEQWFDFKPISKFISENLSDTNIPVVKIAKMPFNGVSLKAYTEKEMENTKDLVLYNYHFYPIKVVGYGAVKDAIIPINPIELPGYRDTNVLKKEYLSCPKNSKYLFYEAEGVDSVFSTGIIKWSYPKDVACSSNSNTSIFEIQEDESLVLKKGKYLVENDIIIPVHKKVVIEKGVVLNMTKGAGFISYSPVIAKGTNEEPIFIYSSDSSNNGFSIIKAGDKSALNYVTFSNLKSNVVKFNNTGGVSFYKSDVTFNNCSFKHAKSEDALNIVASNFKINNCKFYDCFSDALDVDFGKGEILNSMFHNIGNDAIDVSFSEVFCDNNEIRFVSDKGISCGEKSNIQVFNTTVSDAKVGIIAKDESQVLVDGLTIEKADYGLVLFNKKSTFDGCEVTIKNPVFNLIGRDFLIDKNSTLIIKEEVIIGKDKIDAKQFN